MSGPLKPNVRYLADCGLEARLADEGRSLPAAAAFILLEDEPGRTRIADHYRQQAQVAKAHGFGFVFEAPTWRANTDWGDTVGYCEAQLAQANIAGVKLCRAVQQEFASLPSLVAGQVGSRNAEFEPGCLMSADEAAIYHRVQIATLKRAGADLVMALGINDVEEAVGIAIAARCTKIACAISFVCDGNGRLPSGQGLRSAIEEVDARTSRAAAFYSVTCPCPMMVAYLSGPSASRIGAVRLGRQRSFDLPAKRDTVRDPVAMAADYRAICAVMANVRVYGGAPGCESARPVPLRPLPPELTAFLTLATA